MLSLDRLKEVWGTINPDDIPVYDEGNPFTESLCLLNVVGGEKYGRPLLMELSNYLPDLPAAKVSLRFIPLE